MGFTPREVGQMSLWEFWACFAGWVRANRVIDDNGQIPAAGSAPAAAGKARAPTPSEHRARLARSEARRAKRQAA